MPDYKRISRRVFVAGAATAGMVSTILPNRLFAQGGPTDSKLPPRGEFVIRGAYVMTMDPALGDIVAGDVHVRDGAIVAVGKTLQTGAAQVIDGRGMILMPGLVDTHTHLWTTQMRGRFGDTKDNIYFKTRNVLANGYRAEDMYRGTRLGAAESIHSGITTVLDFCHNVRNREFAELSIRALTETGLRARFLYGASTISKPTETIDLAHFESLAKSWKSQVGDAPVTLGLAWRGPLGIVTITSDQPKPEVGVAKEEIEAARRLGLPISVHVSGVTAKAQFEALSKGNYLGKDVQLVHLSNATADQLRAVKEADASVSLTPITELRVGYGITQLGDYLDSNIRVGMGIDSNSLAGASNMFTVLKLFQSIEAGRKKDELALSARRLLELATIEGARSLGMDDIIGSIKPGKRADLILVTTQAWNMGMFADDPAHLLVEAASPDNVDTVIVDGRILKRGSKLTALNPETVIGEAKMSISDIVQRVR